jgi:hypothetical protein
MNSKLLKVANIMLCMCYDGHFTCSVELKVYFSHILHIPAKATFEAISKTYSYLTPDMWKETEFTKNPYQEFTDYLAKNHISGQKAAPTEAAPPKY